MNLLEPPPKSNFCYTRGVTPKHVTSGGAYLRSLALGLDSSKKRHSGGELLATLCRLDRPGNSKTELTADPNVSLF